jgi:hypothetical protein
VEIGRVKQAKIKDRTGINKPVKIEANKRES